VGLELVAGETEELDAALLELGGEAGSLGEPVEGRESVPFNLG
jgi:hypothetical protein